MRFFKWIKKSAFAVWTGIKRFPVPIFSAAAASILAIASSEISDSANRSLTEIFTRISMVTALGVPASLCISLYFEKAENIKSSIKAVLYLFLIPILAVYYTYLLPNQTMVPLTRYIAFNIVLYLCALVIPYFFTKDNFELFIIKLISNLFITIAFSLVIFIGISAILFTIENLLDIHVYNKLYLYMFIIIEGIFAPSYFLSLFPESSHVFENASYPKYLRVLLLYILIPIICAYTLILYIYMFKVAITSKWPQGMVGNLVLWYSLISTLVIFLISPIKKENRYSTVFVSSFTKLIIPLLVIMFVSIGIRINIYGVTESRYFVMVLGIWVLGIMIYWNLSKTKRNIILPVSLAIVAFLSVCSPFSAYSISTFSQNRRFENILLKYQMLISGKIVKSEKSISEYDKTQIQAVISYFNEKHSLKELKYVPSGFKTDDIEKVFGFKYSSDYYVKNETRFFSYYLADNGYPYQIDGYDFFFDINSKMGVSSRKKQDISAEYENNSNKLIIRSSGKEIYRKDLNQAVSKLYDKYGTSDTKSLSSEDMSFDDENSNIKIRLLFHDIYGNKLAESNQIKTESLGFYVFFKLK